jgi:hypothetical protein
MYHIYKKRVVGSSTEYTLVNKADKVCLFGCNNGWIPWILKQSLVGSKANSEPLKWHISEDEIKQELEKDQVKPSGNALVIDLKPSDTANLSLYEVLEAWGCSENGWTPVMLRLNALFIDADAKRFSRERFTRADAQATGPIFSMYYVRGSVGGGELTGTWNLPGPSSTNSVLLWPDTLTYFSEEANRILTAV